MSIDASRTSQPVDPDVVRVRGVGHWGMALAILTIVTFYGALVTSYLYLRSGQPMWPPQGVPDPPVLLSTIAAVAVVAGALASSVALTGVREDRPGAFVAGVAVSGALGLVAGILRAVDLGGVGVRWDEHAYGSLTWTLTIFEITAIAVGVIMAAVLLVQTALRLLDPRGHVAVAVTAMYWWMVALIAVVNVALIHYLPML